MIKCHCSFSERLTITFTIYQLNLLLGNTFKITYNYLSDVSSNNGSSNVISNNLPNGLFHKGPT